MSRNAFALPLIIAVALSTSLRAQSPQAQTRILTGGFWRTDSGFDSVLRLKNSLVVGPLTASPVIYMADGTEYDLPAVQLDTSAVATVDLNAALANAPASIRAHISSFGSVAVRYSYTNPFALEASVGVISTLRSLSFTFPFHEQQNGPSQPQRIESLWWKHDSGVRGALIFANTTSSPLQVALSPFGALGTAAPVNAVSLSPNATQVVSLESLISSLPSAESTQGGLSIEYSAPAGSLAFAGALVNPATGYSASMPFDYRPHKTPSAGAQTYAAPGIMIGQQDVSMGFTSTQRFAPYAYLRNTTAQPLAVSLTFSTLGNSQPIQLSPVTLAPNQTLGVNFPAEFAAVSGSANLGGIINLLVSYSGGPSDLLMSFGSVNQSGNFVSAILPENVGPNGARQNSYWKNADGSDTMITVWNPSTTAADLLAMFYFNGGAGQYQRALHLNAGASQMVDMKELISGQQPDAQGRTIPLGTGEGSLVLGGPNGIEDMVNVAASAVIYNPEAATCATQCTTCAGITGSSVETTPFATYISGSVQLGSWATYNTGSKVSRTSVSTWGSSNSNIATVSAGLVRGVSPGQDNVTASFSGTGFGQNCPGEYDANGDPVRCPGVVTFQPVGSGTVHPTVSISGPSNVPMLAAGTQGTDSVQLTASPNPAGGTFNWTVASGSNLVTLLNSTSQTVIVQSVAVGSATIQVSYTLNSQSATATQGVKVQKPGSLGVVSNTTPAFDCGKTGLPSYNTVDRLIQYQTLDTASPPVPIPVAGMNATESLTVLSNNCNVAAPSPTIDAMTLSNGNFPGADTLQLCSAACLPAGSNGQPLGSCSAQVAQTWTVNGFPVKSDTITYTCPGPPTGAP